jgi:hypothetical protein
MPTLGHNLSIYLCGENINSLVQCEENILLCCHLYYAGNYAGAGNPPLMLDFRWVRGNITRGRCLAFIGAGKVPAVNFSTGSVNAGKDPRT